jgi:protein SCO1/2
VQPLFVSVDPERDTPDQLAKYVPFFHPRLIGLTGSAEVVRKAASAYRAYFAKAALSGGNEYTVDHSSLIYYLMDRAANISASFRRAARRGRWSK